MAPTSIELSEPKWIDLLAMGAFAALTVAGLFAPDGEASFLGASSIAVLVCYFRWRTAKCDLVLSERGIVVRAYSLGPYFWRRPYYCVGVIPWRNFSAAGVTKAQMTKCLGLIVADPDNFLRSRAQFRDEQTVAMISRNSVAAAGRFTQLLSGPLLRFIGCTEAPRSDGEVAVLEWNRANYGYHIVILARPIWFFGRPFRGGPQKVAEVIREHATLYLSKSDLA
jgi:hypothetical protein